MSKRVNEKAAAGARQVSLAAGESQYESASASTWALRAMLGLAIAGLAIASYLTITETGSLPLACPENSVVDCATVTHSVYSQFGGSGIPISAGGILWFLVMALAVGAALFRPAMDSVGLAAILAGLAAIGMAYVLYLVYAEVAVLHRICAWCTAVHVAVLALLLLALLHLQERLAAADELDGEQ